jgi:hypothetical protein
MSNALCPFERQSLLKVIVVISCACVLTGPVALASADPPQRDPAGIATGDKTTTSDAGGNAFVVPEPTDKAAPDTPRPSRHSTSSRLRPPESRLP